jgi:hypothetical protein
MQSILQLHCGLETPGWHGLHGMQDDLFQPGRNDWIELGWIGELCADGAFDAFGGILQGEGFV